MKKKRITDAEAESFSTKDADYELGSEEKKSEADAAARKRKIKLAALSAVAVVAIVATVLFAVVAFSGRKATEITDTLIYTYVDSPEYGSGYMLEGFPEGLELSDLVKLHLPADVDGVPVIGIFDRAFYGCESLVAVYMPDSVKYIGSSAFYGCTSLHEVYMPTDLEYVGADAFLGCDKLEVVNIGSDALDEWCGIEFADYTSNPLCYGASLYFDGSPVFELNIPYDVSAIGEYAFYGLEGVESIYLHSGLKYVGAWAMPCTETTTIYCEAGWRPDDWAPEWNVFGLPVVWDYMDDDQPPVDEEEDERDDTSEEIRDENGNGIPDDEEIAGPDDDGNVEDGNAPLYKTDASGIMYYLTTDGYYMVVGIDDSYLYDGVVLTILPEIDGVPVRVIDDYAFSDYASIGGFIIPEGVAFIGDYAFYGCLAINSIHIPGTVSHIGNYAFAYCSELDNATIGEGVESIGEYAFYNCSSLGSILIPATVFDIDCFALDGTVLSAVYYGGTYAEFASVNVDMTDVDFTELLYIYSESAPRVPGRFWHYDGDAVKLWAEYHSTGLEFTLADNGEYYILTGIGDCTDDYIVIPATYNGLSVCTVGETAFYGNENITAVYIPDGITGIGDGAFALCSALTEVYIGRNVTQIGEVAFANSVQLASITVSDKNESFDSLDGNLYTEDYRILVQYAVGKTDTRFSVPEGTYTIGGYAFYACDSLEQVALPTTLTGINKCAFHSCTSLEYVDMSATQVEYIEAWAFAECRSLVFVNIWARTESIGEGVFEDCYALGYIIIPESVTDMGRYVFRNTDLTVYCEATSQPTGWSVDWNLDGAVVVWDCYTGSEGLSYFISDDGTYYNVVGIGDCTDKDIVIPPLLPHGVPVRGIGARAFNYSKIETIVITDGIRWIEESAFNGCNDLISVTIGKSVEEVGLGAFGNCGRLAEIINRSDLVITTTSGLNSSINFSPLLVHTGESIIDERDGYRFITADGKIYLLGYYGTDTYLVLPENYDGSSYEIYKYAFYGSKAQTVILSDGVTAIGDYAFCSTDLAEVYIPATVTNVVRDAFYYCTEATVYCEAAEQPSGWNSLWLYGGGTAVWDCDAISSD